MVLGRSRGYCLLGSGYKVLGRGVGFELGYVLFVRVDVVVLGRGL